MKSVIMAVFDMFVILVHYLPWALICYIVYDANLLEFRKGYSFTPSLLAITVYTLSNVWANKVSQIVPAPYLVGFP